MELIILIIGGLYLFFKIRNEPPRRNYGKMYAEKFKAAQRKMEEDAARKSQKKDTPPKKIRLFEPQSAKSENGKTE
jgi:uncharacterized membrane protein